MTSFYCYVLMPIMIKTHTPNVALLRNICNLYDYYNKISTLYLQSHSTLIVFFKLI